MQPDEVGRLDNGYAIYFMRGEYPVIDQKYDVWHHPNIHEIGLGGAAPYNGQKHCRNFSNSILCKMALFSLQSMNQKPQKQIGCSMQPFC